MTDTETNSCEQIYNYPTEKYVESLTTAKNLRRMLSLITQQYDKNELLQILPLVEPDKIDSTKMIKLPLKEGGELHLGAFVCGIIRIPIMGFSGERFGTEEIFVADVDKKDSIYQELKPLNVGSLSDDTVIKCGRITKGDVDWDGVESSNAAVAEVVKSVWEK